jgi:putative tryptophan/tyrosine transport system substrate-binding protein
MRRREFIAGLGAATISPIATSAQQTSMPVVGFVANVSPGAKVPQLAGFREGLTERVYAEGRNVAIEYRRMAISTDFPDWRPIRFIAG